MSEDQLQPEVNYYPLSDSPVSSGIEIQTNTPAVQTQQINIVNATNGSVLNGGTIQSTNYVKGESGWQIDSNGNASFMSVNVNGSTISNQNVFGDGSDGDVTISDDTTLTADMYYDNLTIASGKTLNPGGFRIYVKDTLTFQGTGKISAAGGNAGNGTAAANNAKGTGGSAGSAAYTAAGTLPAALNGKAGGVGSDGMEGSCDVTFGSGVAGDNAAKSIAGAGSAGGKGGDGDNGCVNTGSGGGAGSATGTIYNTIRNQFAAYNLFDVYPAFTAFTANAGSGSGGGGAGGRTGGGGVTGGGGGGGGGSGASGGVVFVSAKKIVTVNGNTYITVAGGNGGNGGNGALYNSAKGGGGGGGGGGRGGVIVLFYSTLEGTGTTSVAGGSAGAAGGSPGNGGVAGTAGNAGVSIVFII